MRMSCFIYFDMVPVLIYMILLSRFSVTSHGGHGDAEKPTSAHAVSANGAPRDDPRPVPRV